VGSEVWNNNEGKDRTKIFKCERRDNHGVNAGCLPCDLIVATPTLLGTQNPELFGLENKVLRVVLGWDPLHGLRLAKIEGKNQWSRVTRSTDKLTHNSPILFGTRHQSRTWYEQRTETDLVSPQSEWRPPWSGNPCVNPGYNPRCRQPVSGDRGVVRINETHELAHPISWFSHRPPPCNISKSIFHCSPLAPPLCMVFRVGA